MSHVTARGNERRRIFRDSADYRQFLKQLALAVARYCPILPGTDILSPRSNSGILRRRGEPFHCQVPVMSRFPSLKARALLAVLCREPLDYRVVRQVGSHRRLEAPNRPSLTLAFHERTTIAPGLVRKILVDDVGLTEDEARRLL